MRILPHMTPGSRYSEENSTDNSSSRINYSGPDNGPQVSDWKIFE